MSGDDLKKYWAQRAQQAENLPHYKPAHETLGLDVSKLARQFAGEISPEISSNRNGEIDATALLAKRLAARGPGGPGFQHHEAGPSKEVVDLKEGLPFYVNINTAGLNDSTRIFRQAGLIGGKTAKGVQITGESSGYLTEYAAVVDISKLKTTQNPVSLVEVSVPFTGRFFVPREAIIRKENPSNHNFGGNRTLLKG